MQRIVNIGEHIVSDNIEDSIITYALGSCVAVTIYCPHKKVLGMAHCALPSSLINAEQSRRLPGYYVDTALDLLVKAFVEDYKCRRSDLVVRLFGGSRAMYGEDIFNVGQRNLEAAISILRAYQINFDMKETGGCASRTVQMEVDTGKVKLITYPLSMSRMGG